MKKFIPTSTGAIILTILLAGIGSYFAYEHRKKEGFWWGALAAALILAIIVVSQLDSPAVPVMASGGTVPAPMPTPVAVAPVVAPAPTPLIATPPAI